MTPTEFIVLFICGLIIGAIMVYLQPYIDSWSIDQKFIVASILTIVGWLILRRMRDKTHKHRLFYLAVGNLLLGVGVGILIMTLIKWITARTVF